MKLITVKNAEYQIITALKMNRVKRSQTHEVFVEGIESIKQLLSAGIEITRVIIHDEENLSDWGKSLVAKHKSKVISMSFDLYKELCDREEPSEVLVTAKIEPLALENLSVPEKPFVLIFDRPSDYGNFGSIVRSANSFKVDAIFVIGHGIDMYDPKVIRSSLGGIFHSKMISIESMQALETWIQTQKGKNNLQVIGTDSTGSLSLSNTKLEKPLALVIGNEAKGMSVALKNLCDVIVSIPISGAVNSLNVANAASIFMWEVYKNI